MVHFCKGLLLLKLNKLENVKEKKKNFCAKILHGKVKAFMLLT